MGRGCTARQLHHAPKLYWGNQFELIRISAPVPFSIALLFFYSVKEFAPRLAREGLDRVLRMRRIELRAQDGPIAVAPG
jgi:hypothetical protein